MIRFARIDAAGRAVALTKTSDIGWPSRAGGEWVEAGAEVRPGDVWDRAARAWSRPAEEREPWD